MAVGVCPVIRRALRLSFARSVEVRKGLSAPAFQRSERLVIAHIFIVMNKCVDGNRRDDLLDHIFEAHAFRRLLVHPLSGVLQARQ